MTRAREQVGVFFLQTESSCPCCCWTHNRIDLTHRLNQSIILGSFLPPTFDSWAGDNQKKEAMTWQSSRLIDALVDIYPISMDRRPAGRRILPCVSRVRQRGLLYVMQEQSITKEPNGKYSTLLLVSLVGGGFSGCEVHGGRGVVSRRRRGRGRVLGSVPGERRRKRGSRSSRIIRAVESAGEREYVFNQFRLSVLLTRPYLVGVHGRHQHHHKAVILWFPFPLRQAP